MALSDPAPAPRRRRAGAVPFTRVVLMVSTWILVAACASRSGSGAAFQWGGEPAAVAAAGPLLAEHAAGLEDVGMLEAVCQRADLAADGATRGVDEGRLFARRDAPCVVLRVTAPTPRVVREDAKTRLVVEPLTRKATRWVHATNRRGVLAVAAIFLDLTVLAREFDVAAVASAPTIAPEATRIVLTPRAGATPRAIVERLELVLVPGQSVPTLVTVVGAGGDQVEYRIQRPNLDPPWRDPAARFAVEVPDGYALEELTVP